MKMLPSHGFGARARYLREQDATMEALFGKADRARVGRKQDKNAVLASQHPGMSQIAARGRSVLAREKAQPGVDNINKRDYVKTTMSDEDAKHVAGKYGLKGPLPKDLPREERMRAYEGRYLAAGGRKAEHWDRTADRADKVRNGALAAGTGAAGVLLASRTKAGRSLGRRLVRLPGAAAARGKVGQHAENAALGTAVVGGTAELTAGHARKKRASYSGSPGGVAASALRRMQQYTPEP